MKITQNAFLRKIRNIHGGDWLKELKNVLTDITSDFKNENGESLLTEDKKINSSFLPISPSLEGTNYVFVQGNGTPLENGVELVTAYETAKTMSPRADNRITVVVAPGEYKLANTLVMDTEFVDLVSLTGNADVILDLDMEDPVEIEYDPEEDTYILLSPGEALMVSTDNVLVSGLAGKLRESNNWDNFWSGLNVKINITLSGDYPNTKFVNCHAGFYSFGSNYIDSEPDYINISSYFENCSGWDYSFGYNRYIAGTFINCSGRDNCFTSDIPFYSVEGLFNKCSSGEGSFNANFTVGSFYDCTAGRFSFGFNNSAGGLFKNCIGSNSSFGSGGNASGLFYNCIGGSGSFGGEGGNLLGKLYFCQLLEGQFTTVSGSGRTYYCIDGDGNTNNQ